MLQKDKEQADKNKMSSVVETPEQQRAAAMREEDKMKYIPELRKVSR
jgi:hypothetical protein